MSDSNSVIDDAIVAHTEWLTKFTNSLKDIGAPSQWSENVGNHQACTFGKWLMTTNARNVLGEYLFAEVSLRHFMFHVTAEEIAQSLKGKYVPTQLLNKIEELEDVSYLLIKSLNAAKRNFKL